MLLTTIPRRSRKCHRKEEPFEAGSFYYSRLIPVKEGHYERADFCPACWKEESAISQAVSWKGKVPKKTVQDKALEKVEHWIDLLRESLESDEEEAKKEAYLIALFLKRKKILHERGEIKGKCLFEMAETEEVLMVPKVHFTEADKALELRLSSKL